MASKIFSGRWRFMVKPIAPLFLFFVFSSASALELTGVSVEPSEIAVGRQVQITVDLKGQGNNSWCGLLINFGDGSSEHIRVEENKLPFKLAHTYDRIGNFSLSAEGKTLFRGLNTSITCTGSSHSAAVNVRAEDFAEKEAIEQAAKETAFKKAAAERQAAERAAEIATAERIEADRTAQKATTDRSAAERAARKATTDRSAAERAAQKATTDRSAAERAVQKATTERTAAERAAQKATTDRSAAEQTAASAASARASADRLAAEKAARTNESNDSSLSSPPEANSPKKSTSIKARSAMDL